MENLLQGIPKVCVYLDDILITGATEAEHLNNLYDVLIHLEQAGKHLKKNKCAFLFPQVDYLGHRISHGGLHPTEEKVRAIVEVPVPYNVSQLKSCLGMLNYYSKFLSNLSTVLAPLTTLELGNITILSYIVILKCHDNRYRRDFFSIVISPMQYYR